MTKLTIEINAADPADLEQAAEIIRAAQAVAEAGVTAHIEGAPAPKPPAAVPAATQAPGPGDSPPTSGGGGGAAEAFGGPTLATNAPGSMFPPSTAPTAGATAGDGKAIQAPTASAGPAEVPASGEAGQPCPNANKAGYPRYNAAGIPVDGLELPWDHRINTKSKLCLTKAPNEWKVIRNTDPAIVEQVRNELRAALSAPAPIADSATTTPVTAPAPVAPQAPAPASVVAPPPQQVQAATAQQAQAATAQQAQAATAPIDFPTLMKAIAVAGIPDETLAAAVAKVGLPGVALLATRADLVKPVSIDLGLGWGAQ